MMSLPNTSIILEKNNIENSKISENKQKRGLKYYLKKITVFSLMITFLVMFLSSFIVILALIDEDLIAKNETLEVQLSELQSENRELKTELAKTRSENKSLNIKISKLQSENEKISQASRNTATTKKIGDIITDKAVEEGMKRTFNFIFGE